MATATLSLFPSPSLKNKSSPKSGLRYGQLSAKEPDFEMVKMSDSTQAIVIAIEEKSAPNPRTRASADGTSPGKSPEQHHLPSIVLSAPSTIHAVAKQSPSTTTRPRTPSPPPTQVRPTSTPASPVNSSSRSQPPSPLRVEGSPRSRASSPTLVRRGSNASTRTATHSPIMRSMFPRYDPSLPLNRQQYYPSAQGGTDVPGQTYRQSSRPSAPLLVIPTSSGAAPILQQTANGPATSTFSTPDELVQLWDIANGQNQDGTGNVFKIELGCDSLKPISETISFSSSSQKLYSLSASSNGLNISRTHPLHPTPTIPICKTTLFIPTATSPLLATIFPALAEIMALDQSSSIAVTHRLKRTDSSLLQAEAISRAQQNEASNLLWDSDSGKYFLIHPTLLDNASTTFPIQISPSALNPSQIVIAAPETNGTTPLLALDLVNRTLCVHSGPVKALPSLYMLDTLVTAMLTLLLHLHRSSSDPPVAIARDADVVPPSFPPPPTLLTLASRSKREKKRSLSTWSRSVFSQRNPTRETPGSEADLEFGHRVQDGDDASTEIVVTQKKNQAEHDWTFQPLVNADDEALPSSTRAVLRTLYWGFQVFVWILGVGVNLIAAGIVRMGKLVKKA